MCDEKSFTRIIFFSVVGNSDAHALLAVPYVDNHRVKNIVIIVRKSSSFKMGVFNYFKATFSNETSCSHKTDILSP